ncbi:MAG: hypothetical protein ACJ71F_06185 [Nitrososphaeraceae archaeon]
MEFFKILEEKPTGMKGFLVMDAMDEFYKPDNTTLADLVEDLTPSFEQLPAREDYQVIQFKV